MKSSLPFFGSAVLLLAVATAFRLRSYPGVGVQVSILVCAIIGIALAQTIGISHEALANISPFELIMRAWAINLLFFVGGSFVIAILMRRVREAQTLAGASKSSLVRQVEFLYKANQPVFSWDQEGVILFWNSGAERLYGFSREEAIGRSYRDFLRLEQSARSKEICAALAQEKHWQGELKHRTRDGREIAVECSMTVIEDSTGRKTVLETNHDISKRERTEEALVRTNEHLQQLTYAAAHDLQEPLRNLALSLDLLNTTHGSHLGVEGGALVSESIRNARRMHRMIKDLKVFGSISGEPRTGGVAVNVNEVLRDVLELLAESIEEKEAEIVIGPMPTLTVDRTHLVELFQHLIANSLQYRSPEIPVRIEISATRHNSEYVFSIKDNGIGFDQAYAERIFGIFKRLHHLHQHEGTGMGLAICALIVRQYGGRIWAESKPGEGATFYFAFAAGKEMIVKKTDNGGFISRGPSEST